MHRRPPVWRRPPAGGCPPLQRPLAFLIVTLLVLSLALPRFSGTSHGQSPPGTWREAQQWYDQGQRFERAGERANAESIYRTIITGFPDHFGAQYALGRLVLKRDPARALPYLQKASALRPTSDRVHYRLGQAQEAHGLLLEAAESYRQAIRINARHRPANNRLRGVLRRLRARLSTVEQAAEHFWASPSLASLMMYGRIVMRDAAPRQALLEFESLRQRLPALAEVELWIARAYRRLGNEGGEILAYRRYVDQHPRAVNVRLALIDRLVVAGRYRDATAALNPLLPGNRSGGGALDTSELGRRAFLNSRIRAGLGQGAEATSLLLEAHRQGVPGAKIETAFRADIARLSERGAVQLAYAQWLQGEERPLESARTLAAPCTSEPKYRSTCRGLLDVLLEQPKAINRARVILGQMAMAGGNEDEAIRLLDAVPPGDDADGEASLRLGLLHRRRGDLERSIDALTQYVFSFPTRTGMYFARGNIFWETERPDKAVLFWLNKPESISGRPEALRRAADYLQRQGGAERELRVRAMLWDQSPGDLRNRFRMGSLYFALGQSSAAVEAWRGVLEARVGDYDLLVEMRNTLRANNYPQMALRALWQAAQVRTLKDDMAAGLAAALAATGRYQEALSAYWQLYQNNPGHPVPRQALPELVRLVPAPLEYRLEAARIAERTGRIPLAVELLEELLSIASAHREARLTLARLLLQEHSPEEARRVLTEWPDAPRELERLTLLAQAQTALADGEGLVRTLKHLEALEPANPAHPRLRALTLVDLGRDGEAYPLLQKTAARNPRDRDVLLALADTDMRENRPAEAMAGFRKLLALDSGDAPARRGLIQTLTTTRQWKPLTVELELWLNENSEDTRARETIIMAYLQSFSRARAKPHYDVLRRLNPGRARRMAPYFP